MTFCEGAIEFENIIRYLFCFYLQSKCIRQSFKKIETYAAEQAGSASKIIKRYKAFKTTTTEFQKIDSEMLLNCEPSGFITFWDNTIEPCWLMYLSGLYCFSFTQFFYSMIRFMYNSVLYNNGRKPSTSI